MSTLTPRLERTTSSLNQSPTMRGRVGSDLHAGASNQHQGVHLKPGNLLEHGETLNQVQTASPYLAEGAGRQKAPQASRSLC